MDLSPYHDLADRRPRAATSAGELLRGQWLRSEIRLRVRGCVTVDLPTPVTRAPAPPALNAEAFEKVLRSRVEGEVRFDAGSRAAYSTDASNVRQVPIGVIVPRTPEAAVEAVAVAREFGAPSCRVAAAPAWQANAPTPRW